jgi:hypothetical protein
MPPAMARGKANSVSAELNSGGCARPPFISASVLNFP